MNFRGWLFIFFVYIAYLLIGGLTFQAIECEESPAVKPKDPPRTYYAYFYNKMKDKFRETTNVTVPDCDRWSLYNSVFFSFTCITTIGFGHLAPDTWQGKVFCIFYSLLGIPINGILIGYIAGFFGSIPQRFKRNSPQDEPQFKSVLFLFLQVIAYLVPGFVVFMAIPAVIFWHIEEGWTYLDSLYFSFVTLTTIGFGDYVAGRDMNVLLKLGHWKIVYESALIVWILFGLGYLVMIINIISEGLTRPAMKAARKFAEAERSVIEKILRELVNNRSKSNCFDKNHAKDPSINSAHGNGLRYEVLNGDNKNHEWSFEEHEQELASKSVSFDGETMEPTEVSPVEDSHTSIDMDDLNHDTITSLRQFVKTAEVMQCFLKKIPDRSGGGVLSRRNRSGAASSLSAGNDAETSFISQYSVGKLKQPFKSRRKVSDYRKTASFNNSLSSDIVDKSRSGLRELLRGRSVDVINSSSNSSHFFNHQSTSNPQLLENILRNTTVEEFIQAMSKVDVESDE